MTKPVRSTAALPEPLAGLTLEIGTAVTLCWPDGRRRELERRAAALAARLALEGPQARTVLAAWLWPELDAARARANLRQRLLALRAAADGQGWITGETSLALAQGVLCKVVDDGGDDGFPAAEQTDAAPTRVGSLSLLSSLDHERDLAVSEWVRGVREQALRRTLATLAARAVSAEQQGDLDAATAAVRQQVVLEPLAETHRRELMRLYYLQGDTARAEAAYGALRRMLAEEFGAVPSPQAEALRTLARRAALGRIDAEPGHPLPVLSGAAAVSARQADVVSDTAPWPAHVALALRRPPRMVGRAAEQQRLAAQRPGSPVLRVQGEAGLGKSRLLAEAVSALAVAPRAGTTMLAVKAQAGDAGVPYATLARLLRVALQSAGHAALPHAALAPLLPDLPPRAARDESGVPARGAEPKPDVVTARGAVIATPRPPPPRADAPVLPLPPDGQRLLLQSACAELLRQAGARAVVVDDLHFADEASIDMIAALNGPAHPQAPAGTVLPPAWVITLRPGEAQPAARRWFERLQEEGALDTLTLAPLTVPQLAELLRDLALPGVDAEALAPRLWAHSGGNPLFALETLKLGPGAARSGAHVGLPRPGGVQALVEGRLRLLPEGALALARVVALAGPDFSIDLAEAVTGRRAVELADAWNALRDAQLMHDEGGFAHDLVLDAVLRSLPPPIARHLHAQLAGFLASRPTAPARLADHWSRAGRPAEAAAAWDAAAQAAYAAGRHREEADFHGRAAAAWDEAHRVDERFAARCSRVDALVRADLGDDSLAAAQALEAEARSPAQRLRAIRHHTDMLANRGQADAAVARARDGLALIDAGTGGPDALSERLRLNSALIGTLLLQMRGNEARRAFDDLAQHLGPDPDAQARTEATLGAPERQLLANMRANLAWVEGRLRAAIPAFEQAAALAGELGQVNNVAVNLNNVATAFARLGLNERAAEAAERALRLRRATGEGGPGVLHQTILNLARARRDQGRYDEALALYEECVAGFRQSGGGLWLLITELQLASTWLRLGQTARALALLHEDDGAAPPFIRGQRRLARAEALAASGAAAQRWYDEGWALIEPHPAYAPSGEIAWLASRPPTEVALRADRLIAEARAGDRGGTLLGALVRRAQAGAALSDGAAAEAAASEALRLLDDGYTPDSLGLPAVWLAAADAALAVDLPALARQRAEQGVGWLRGHALPHVPAVFTESFLQRQPVHRALLGLLERLAST